MPVDRRSRIHGISIGGSRCRSV